MAHLLKTEAIVLRKLDYGDTSKIASLFTEELGRISVIIKSGRKSNTKIGLIVDPLNSVQVVIHNKETREIQLITQADLVLSPTVVKDDLERIKYSSAISELVFALIPEHEPNKKLYKGLKRILALMNDINENPKILFVRFFLFFLKEIGYELQFNECSGCGADLSAEREVYYSSHKGVLCPRCREDHVVFFDLSQELLQILICLNDKKKGILTDMKALDRIIYFLEKYLSYHIEEFKSIKSLHIY